MNPRVLGAPQGMIVVFGQIGVGGQIWPKIGPRDSKNKVITPNLRLCMIYLL